MQYDYPTMNGEGWGWGIAMMMCWLVFLLVLVVVIVHLRGHNLHHGFSSKTEPIDIAKERYAKGEITKEQFEQLKKDLSK